MDLEEYTLFADKSAIEVKEKRNKQKKDTDVQAWMCAHKYM